MSKICIFLVYVFILFHIGHGRTGFVSEVTKCCQYGMQQARRRRDLNCEAIGRQAETNMRKPGLVCRVPAELCCVKQLQENLCNMGKSLALNGGMCATQSAIVGREDHKECCYCCYLGMEAKRRNMGCRQSSVLGFPCQKAFSSCCLQNTRRRRTCSSLGCSQSCLVLNNVPTCVCRNGFKLNRNRRTCDDVDECSESGKCNENQICSNTYGSYNCTDNVQKLTCRTGYQSDSSGTQCIDIDECATLQPCSSGRVCENTQGSYRCNCPQGYELVGSRCQDIDECSTLEPCSSGTECENTPGSYRCNCPQGYELVGSRCQDVNECATLRNPCRARNEQCQNVAGSYRCECEPGYERSGSTCSDVDECSKNLCRPNERCVNLPGTYRCSRRRRPTCAPGYRHVRGRCVDVNECEEDKTLCPGDNKCFNIAGSYRCVVQCSPGYERVSLDNDCQDIDECANGNPCQSGEQCLNVPGSYRCTKLQSCPSGYEPFNGKCQDKDECLIENICRAPRPNCVNIPGSYRCEYNPCEQGFERDRNGRCIDVDECRTGRHICKPRAEQCINMNGTYSCRCNLGYTKPVGDQHCKDRDECSGSDRYCAHKCINTEGSFRCECRKGYQLIDKVNCKDIDECDPQKGVCEHLCTNTQGSYYCRCKPGFKLHSNKASCTDINECLDTSRCDYQCRNSPGSYSCTCPPGFKLLYSRYCVDVDECTRGNPCTSGETSCVNTKGGYRCIRTRCPSSLFIKRSSTHCTRKGCQLSDTRCQREKRKSIRWHGRGLPNKSGPGAFSYFYNITTTGYNKTPEIRFSIKSGNVGNAFHIFNVGYGKANLKNIKVLRGPYDYRLEFAGEVISNGKVTASFVTYLHIFVSRYDF